MRTVALLAAIGLSAVAAVSASAESVDDAVARAGIAGIWAAQCSKDLQQGGNRLVIQALAGGPVVRTENAAAITTFRILAAETLAQGEIHLIEEIVDINTAKGARTAGKVGDRFDIVFRKTGNRLVLEQSRDIGHGAVIVKDGHYANPVMHGAATPPLLSCLR
jgi:hypothetical protein